jgi:hypothetical protein
MAMQAALHFMRQVEREKKHKGIPPGKIRTPRPTLWKKRPEL